VPGRGQPHAGTDTIGAGIHTDASIHAVIGHGVNGPSHLKGPVGRYGVGAAVC